MKKRALLAALVAIPLAAFPARADEEPKPDEAEGHAWAVGLGYGVVFIDDLGDGYFGINLRRRVGGRDGDEDEQGRSRDEQTGFRLGRQREGIRAFVEAEYGRFKRDDGQGRTDTDQLLGLNVIGVVPARSVDIFLGIGFGMHFLDAEPAMAAEEDSSRVGGNAQFGVEVYVTERVGVFGAGRVDFLEGERLGQQSKVWAGLRVHF
jgi:opacity protein-like surface antigen